LRKRKLSAAARLYKASSSKNAVPSNCKSFHQSISRHIHFTTTHTAAKWRRDYLERMQHDLRVSLRFTGPMTWRREVNGKLSAKQLAVKTELLKSAPRSPSCEIVEADEAKHGDWSEAKQRIGYKRPRPHEPRGSQGSAQKRRKVLSAEFNASPSIDLATPMDLDPLPKIPTVADLIANSVSVASSFIAMDTSGDHTSTFAPSTGISSVGKVDDEMPDAPTPAPPTTLSTPGTSAAPRTAGSINSGQPSGFMHDLSTPAPIPNGCGHQHSPGSGPDMPAAPKKDAPLAGIPMGGFRSLPSQQLDTPVPTSQNNHNGWSSQPASSDRLTIVPAPATPSWLDGLPGLSVAQHSQEATGASPSSSGSATNDMVMSATPRSAATSGAYAPSIPSPLRQMQALSSEHVDGRTPNSGKPVQIRPNPSPRSTAAS